MAVFSPNIPQPGDFPSDSQPLLLANAQYLAGTASKGLLRDHDMTLDTANAADGTHKQVTMQANLGGTPAFAGGVSVVYPKTGSGQSQLWFDNGTVDTQLTTTKANVPTIAVSGCSYLPGGILMQWGTGANNVSVTFPVAFTTVYTVVVTPTSLAVTPAPAISAISNSAFTSANSVAQAYNFYWQATGLA